MRWLYTGSTMKTPAELTRLVHDVFLAPEFLQSDLTQFNATRELKRLDKFTATSGAFSADDGWREASVKIRLPKEGRAYAGEDEAPEFEVPNVFVRSFREVVRAAYQDISATRFHWFPFRLLWRRKNVDERLYSDIFNADAMLDEHEKIQRKAVDDREANDSAEVEYVVAPILLYSDSTHLTNFGTAALWPIYVFFGHLSKYIRCRPNAFAAHHLAYVPSLPLSIQAAYQAHYGMPATAAVLRFCKRELMNQIWHLLLDADFLDAYAHGILIQCGDGITRRVFPRIFTYSADYPEKCLLACIKNLAKCPCPVCFVKKEDIPKMGTVHDMKFRDHNVRQDGHPVHNKIATARRFIFEKGIGPEGAAVEAVVAPTSITPTRSAFSAKLRDFGLNVYEIFVPDLMHEFELGVWKAVLTHLIRILIAAGGDIIQKLDRRFALTPTFGRDTIRRFGANISGLKKLAARDFEDILQCAYFAFEGLLPPQYNRPVLKLIFVLATWHALAKLRLHTTTTLAFFDQTTRTLGATMRTFARDVCTAFATRELPKEKNARHRPQHDVPSNTASSTSGGAKRKQFNLHTYKYHRLGDYPTAIRRYGTTDNFNTQTGELEHRRVKQFYAHTNKSIKFAWQIARHQRRQAYLHKLSGASLRSQKPIGSSKRSSRRAQPRSTLPLQLPFEATEPLPPSCAKDHSQISEDQAHPINIREYLAEHRDDPAFKDFLPLLLTHVYQRLATLEGHECAQPPTRTELARIRIDHNRMYIHKIIRVNYTSYDMRRQQDSINPRTHPYIMMLAPSGAPHPYLYAQVISIFHINVYRHLSPDQEPPEPRLLHVLWVRWLDLDTGLPGGFEYYHPHRLKFANADEEPFGFLSPNQVLRGIHILPAWHCDSTRDDDMDASDVPGSAHATDAVELAKDWNYYYVAMWSDRDLFMRFLGGAAGHEHAEMGEAHVANASTGEIVEEEDSEDLPPPPADQEDNLSDDDEDPVRAYVPSDAEGDEDEDHWTQIADDDGEPELGPEDGEEDAQVDDDEANGYALY
ncbi:hypothetical protein C8Q80DRAFT_1115077 [Daedaleopsis nitida]|nr:hypothetical protein C8Q80DRAFT_1115077 [Daedaleopsis nitida]